MRVKLKGRGRDKGSWSNGNEQSVVEYQCGNSVKNGQQNCCAYKENSGTKEL